MRAVFACLLTALLCACAGAPTQTAAPVSPAVAAGATASTVKPLAAGERVEAFLAAYKALVFRGLPNADQAAVLAEHFSPALNGLMHDALAGQQAYKARYPSDKPPMIDGDVFSSLFEGASSGTVDAVDVAADTAIVRVKYVYSDPETGKAIETWPDRFLLVREGSNWLIDDIEYLGGWDFAPKGKLSQALHETAALH